MCMLALIHTVSAITSMGMERRISTVSRQAEAKNEKDTGACR